MRKMGIGLQLYTLRDEMAQDAASVLQKVAEMGYEGVEFAGYYDFSPEQLKALLTDLSLKAIGSHVNMERLQNHLEEEIAMNVAIGSRYVVCPGINQAQRQALPETVAFFNECSSQFASKGIAFGFHNHYVEFTENYGAQPWFDAFFGSTSPDAMKSELDVCWVHHAGCDPITYIDKYAGRVPLIHLKDIRKFADGTYQTLELGRGEMNLPAIIAAAEAAGTEWLIVEQDDCDLPALESVKISMEWLRRNVRFAEVN
ncbi:sugar phosphate isomerase [Paenibacillus baekrokdamisoli]|uniref:Sugar phosphate isomerase n=1 Tax=Paenibacillus baekrokdamisoli TaxID=1712516 RepID=A0A3G9J6J7_9BACL|nr:sugar phosphate isomerase/epimerase [Paenibacillus baekrokdamisoli]MBB3067426.1 sugar phosphate isomerase/epimerase [Paenibacillus baekrokdamisoli]BBH19388.1 sugar phosphate isomerase [Paenibacillus baekrokdamisoli]